MNKPDDPLELLRDQLDRRGWTQQQFSQIIGRPPQAVSEILSRKKQMTIMTALQIAAATGIDAHVWLHMQTAYGLWQVTLRDSVRAELAAIEDRARRA